MKTLFAIRHAKSSWDHNLPDHDRPLNDRGLSDVPKMGDALKSRNIVADLMFSSTANRAYTTAKLLAASIDFPENQIVTDRNNYLASAQTWLQTVQQFDESKQVALIFGHNPGMHAFAERIQKQMQPIEHFPTLSVAHLQFEVNYWGELEWGTAKLQEILYPKAL